MDPLAFLTEMFALTNKAVISDSYRSKTNASTRVTAFGTQSLELCGHEIIDPQRSHVLFNFWQKRPVVCLVSEIYHVCNHGFSASSERFEIDRGLSKSFFTSRCGSSSSGVRNVAARIISRTSVRTWRNAGIKLGFPRAYSKRFCKIGSVSFNQPATGDLSQAHILGGFANEFGRQTSQNPHDRYSVVRIAALRTQMPLLEVALHRNQLGSVDVHFV